MGIQYIGETNNLCSYLGILEYYNLKRNVYIKDPNVDTWLKFLINGKETYISKINICNLVTWDILNKKGLIFGDHNNPITINGKKFIARSPKGLVRDVLDDKTISEIKYHTSINKIHSELRNSEFNQLVYGYINSDLVNFEYSWCQEKDDSDKAYGLLRDTLRNNDISRSNVNISFHCYGFRCILEEV